MVNGILLENGNLVNQIKKNNIDAMSNVYGCCNFNALNVDELLYIFSSG
jgi:hypothetical protein